MLRQEPADQSPRLNERSVLLSPQAPLPVLSPKTLNPKIIHPVCQDQRPPPCDLARVMAPPVAGVVPAPCFLHRSCKSRASHGLAPQCVGVFEGGGCNGSRSH